MPERHRVIWLDNARHHGGERGGHPSMVVWHATAGGSAMSSIEYLNQTADKKASYHYVIDRDGKIYRMTKPTLVAYHAGDSAWPADPARARQGGTVNRRALGVAFANRNDGEPLTAEQTAAGLFLARELSRLHDIAVFAHVGHKEVSPGRKSDPMSLDMHWWRSEIAKGL
jgi:N-acetylmuramoyl-L-alanine amidase